MIKEKEIYEEQGILFMDNRTIQRRKKVVYYKSLEGI